MIIITTILREKHTKVSKGKKCLLFRLKERSASGVQMHMMSKVTNPRAQEAQITTKTM